MKAKRINSSPSPNGTKGTYDIDPETMEAANEAGEIIQEYMNINPARNVIIRQALRSYARYLDLMIHGRPGKTPNGIRLMDVIRSEKARILAASGREELIKIQRRTNRYAKSIQSPNADTDEPWTVYRPWVSQ